MALKGASLGRITLMHSSILWGHDGVLVDSERIFYEANRRYFRGLGIELTAALLRDAPDLAIPGIELVLEQFAESCRMAVVTSSARDHFNEIRQQTGLLKHFDLVVAAGDYAKEKPDPEPYQVAMARLSARPTSCIAVEDSPRGLRAALAAGVDCIVVRSELTERCAFEGAVAIVHSPARLACELQRWQARRGAP